MSDIVIEIAQEEIVIYITESKYSASGGTWGTITGTLSDQTDLQAALAARELIASKSTDGTFAANSDTLYPSQKAAKTYIDARIAALVASSPATLDTLNELAVALGNDPNFATTITTLIGTKEASTNKSTNVNTDQASDVKFPSVKAVYDWAVGLFAPLITSANFGSFINGLTGKTTPVDADSIPLMDSAASNVLKKLSWANIKATLLSYFNTSLTIAPLNAHQGFLINGKIVPSVSSNNLTVAIKTLAGTDPSATDPVYIRIGDTVRSITAALSVTKNAATNWCNSGGAELATQEVDYFIYLGYNATDGVVIGFSRIIGSQYSDFSTTTTNEKYCAISTITNAASTDYYEVVGRFAATLSAGAGYTWTVPTFTAINLKQYPIRETRWLSWTPTYVGFSANPTDDVSVYKVMPARVIVEHSETTNGTSNAPSFTISAPFTAATRTNAVWSCSGIVVNSSSQLAAPGAMRIGSAASVFTINRDYAQTAFTATGGKRFNWGSMWYEI